MSTRSNRALLAGASLLFAATTALAQGASTSGTSSSGGTTGATGPSTSSGTEVRVRLARSDEGFLKQAAQNGHMEIEGSKTALNKASDARVKTFAQQMVDDHGKAHAELSALASKKGVDLPTEPSIAQKAKLKLLSAADGGNFDRRYAETVGVKAHEDTVKMFRKAASEAKDAEVKAFAAKTLPALEKHLTMARELHAAVEKSGKGADDGKR